ncbi:hypothetical protein [Kineococcus auxinigenes]|uniref:hypothetical protein n=1 Tax=unclassified Kineococcus TaxID=2621656 RepID=UPI003D7E33B4
MPVSTLALGEVVLGLAALLLCLSLRVATRGEVRHHLTLGAVWAGVGLAAPLIYLSFGLPGVGDAAFLEVDGGFILFAFLWIGLMFGVLVAVPLCLLGVVSRLMRARYRARNGNTSPCGP